MPGLIGFFEFTFMKQRADLPLEYLAKLMREYLEESQAPEFFGGATPLTRTLVYEEHVPVQSEITTYERAREIIRKGSAAKFLSRRGFAERRTTEEFLAVLDRARDLNLTHITDNIRTQPSFICNCCQCCCELMAGVQMGFHEGINKTGFTAVIDETLCDYCGTCFKACNVKAIGLPKDRVFATPQDRFAAVKTKVCLGCGACISACPKGALHLVEAPNRTLPPDKKRDLFAQMLKERRKLTPFVLSRVGRRLRKVFLGR